MGACDGQTSETKPNHAPSSFPAVAEVSCPAVRRPRGASPARTPPPRTRPATRQLLAAILSSHPGQCRYWCSSRPPDPYLVSSGPSPSLVSHSHTSHCYPYQTSQDLSNNGLYFRKYRMLNFGFEGKFEDT